MDTRKSTSLLAILACLLWSTAFAGIKYGLEYTQPLNFAGIRFFLSGLMLIPFSGNIKSYYAGFREKKKSVLLISLFQTFLLYTFFYIGISMTPAAITAVIIGASPLFSAIIAHMYIRNDRMNLAKMSIILTGLSGVIVIALSRNEYSFSEGQEFWGIVILVVGNVFGNIGNLLVATQRGEMNPVMLNSQQIMLGGLGIFLLSLPFEGFDLNIRPAEYYISLGWLSFMSATAFSIWFILLKRPGVKMSELNIWKFIIPVFGAILSWLIIPGEEPEFFTVLGMILTSLSLVALNLYNLKRTKKLTHVP
ncbi:MAG: DMT family transporter [Bacteroidota bacterium]